MKLMENKKNSSINVRVDFNLVNRIQDDVKISLEFANLSDFTRKALRAFKDGMQLDYIPLENVPKKTLLVYLDDEDLSEFYSSLQVGKRSNLVERILGTYSNLKFNKIKKVGLYA